MSDAQIVLMELGDITIVQVGDRLVARCRPCVGGLVWREERKAKASERYIWYCKECNKDLKRMDGTKASSVVVDRGSQTWVAHWVEYWTGLKDVTVEVIE